MEEQLLQYKDLKAGNSVTVTFISKYRRGYEKQRGESRVPARIKEVGRLHVTLLLRPDTHEMAERTFKRMELGAYVRISEPLP